MGLEADAGVRFRPGPRAEYGFIYFLFILKITDDEFIAIEKSDQ